MYKLVFAILLPAASALSVISWYGVQAGTAAKQADHFVNWARQQTPVEIEFIVSAPQGATPTGQALYLCGGDTALGAWDTAGLPMEKRGDGKYHATVKRMSGIEHTFTVTRGTRESVECGPTGQTIPLHAVTVNGPTIVAVTVAGWGDEPRRRR